ncbi:hypothetical protein HNP38_001846 [Chryseobacterium defluvii]|uniref:Uncharacterized protein n=1 Tax=Chryseobacterium defluvii TaxID=160396 RepID=A0A840KGB1_9FLAO|nr:hypothetical protein [Chryseobacterium defluvii]MBB4806550.1 hypothetical protein [Chryseobacterium defluvii]
MKNIITIAVLMMSFSIFKAQTGIGTATPHASASLDMTSTTLGFLLPRVASGTVVANPATGLLVYNTSKKCIEINLGNPTTPDWNCLTSNKHNRYFYAPSIALPSTGSTQLTYNIYDQYQALLNAPAVKNPSAAASVPFYAVNELNYYIVSYDSSEITIDGISDTGIITYTPLASGSLSCASITVVLEVK